MLRLVLPVLLALISLLTFVKAPSNFFWRVQVALTEFPYISIFASLALLVCSFWFEKFRWTSAGISAVALILFLLPVIRAYSRASGLDQELVAALPSAQKSNSGFSFFRLFSAPPAMTPQELVYKTVNGKGLTLDFYAAPSTPLGTGSGKKNAPCVIVIHGGSWSSGDNKQFVEWNAWMSRVGYHVAAINYRLAPEFKSPSQVEDVSDALDFLKTQNALGIDTNNFCLMGRSAGGQIALCAAYQLHRPEIKGVISFYAPADMVWGAKIKGNPLVLNTDDVFADYLGGPYDQFAGKYYESSAVQHVAKDSPPTLIIHGDNDCMVSFIHSQHLDSALSAAGVPHYFLNLPGATHACDYNLNGPSGQLSQAAITVFLDATMIR